MLTMCCGLKLNKRQGKSLTQTESGAKSKTAKGVGKTPILVTKQATYGTRIAAKMDNMEINRISKMYHFGGLSPCSKAAPGYLLLYLKKRPKV